MDSAQFSFDKFEINANEEEEYGQIDDEFILPHHRSSDVS